MYFPYHYIRLELNFYFVELILPWEKDLCKSCSHGFVLYPKFKINSVLSGPGVTCLLDQWVSVWEDSSR